MTLITTATELPRLMHCIGSRNMQAALPPDHDHEARDEGTAAHWLANAWFHGSQHAAGTKAPNGYVITDEMVDHVGTYISALDCGAVEVETTFSGTTWEVRARADHIKHLPLVPHPSDPSQYISPSTLTIDEFKYGHRLVSPVNNWTLIAHAVGWCLAKGIIPDRIIFRVHQPRAYHPDGPLRTWEISYRKLCELHEQIALRLSNPTNELLTGVDICAKCHALPTCPAARQASMNAIDAANIGFNDTLPADTLIYEYELLQRAEATIKNRREAVGELMTHRINSGTVFNGYGLKSRLANSRWKPGITAEAITLASGVDVRKIDTVTPAEAKRRGMSDEVVKALTERPIIGTKLERIDADATVRKHFG